MNPLLEIQTSRFPHYLVLWWLCEGVFYWTYSELFNTLFLQWQDICHSGGYWKLQSAYFYAFTHVWWVSFETLIHSFCFLFSSLLRGKLLCDLPLDMYEYAVLVVQSKWFYLTTSQKRNHILILSSFFNILIVKWFLTLPNIIGRSSSKTRSGNASFLFVPVLHFLLKQMWKILGLGG
jgi:hypothetical protein